MKKDRRKEIESVTRAAFELVRTCGLSREKFDHASIACLQDALWLISAGGVATAKVVRVMNTEAYAGEAQLRQLRQRLEIKVTGGTRSVLSKKTLDRMVRGIIKFEPYEAGTLVAYLAKNHMEMLLAEIHACLMTEKNRDKVGLVFLEVVRMWRSLKKGEHPEVRGEVLQVLEKDEWDAFFER